MNQFNLKQMGERIRQLRSEKEIGQNKLAADIEVSNASIRYWETGKQAPTAEAIYKLAKYFDVPSDFILGLKDW